MATRVITIDPAAIELALLAEAAALLRAGQLVAFPTETVYGLGANALDAAAVAQIFVAKQRPTTDPLIVHLADVAQLATVARDLPPLAHALAARFWPGPLTLVLARQPAVPGNVSAERPTVAVRVPQHPVALALLRAAGVPVAAPSANLFTRPSPTTAQHVLDDLDGRIDAVVDGGPTTVGLESTVLDLTGPMPTLLRPGGITVEQLRAVIPELTWTPRYLAEDEAAAGPGMLLKHYSPRAEVRLFTGSATAVLAAMAAQIAELAAEGRRIGVLAADEDAAQFAALGAEVFALGAAADLAQLGTALFRGLRALDQAGVAVILVRDYGQTGVGLALWDRLVRAASGRVIVVDEG